MSSQSEPNLVLLITASERHQTATPYLRPVSPSLSGLAPLSLIPAGAREALQRSHTAQLTSSRHTTPETFLLHVEPPEREPGPPGQEVLWVRLGALALPGPPWTRVLPGLRALPWAP